MGQRHQLFVIVNIAGRYRCLCAIHHQWLYGYSAVKRCVRLLKIFGAVENRTPIQQELVFAKSQPNDFWIYRPQWTSSENCQVPFPYIMACLRLGASFDPASGYEHQIQVEVFGMEFDHGDNNDGVTIIDISNLDDVRYCFVKFDEGYESSPVPNMAPLSASVYVLDYQDNREATDKKRAEAILESIDGWKLVTVNSLHDTWPRDGWDGQGIDESEEEETESSGHEITSLRAIAMDKLFQTSLAQPNPDTALLSEAEMLPGFLPEMRKMLYEHAQNLEPTPTSIQVLAKAFEDVSEVSLGIFRKFGAQDLFAVISELQRNKKMRTLDLSNSSTIDQKGLRKILQIMPELQNLYLMGTPALPAHSVLSLLRENSLAISELYHTDLFRLFLAHETDDALKFPTGACTKSPVIQMLWVLTKSHILRASESANNGRVDWNKCRDMPEFEGHFGRFPLDDVLLSPAKLVTGMAQFAKFSLSAPLYGSQKTGTFASVATSSFAMASSNVEGSGFQVGPAPLLLPTIDRWNYRGSWPFLTMGASRPGDWSIIVVQDYDDGIEHDGSGRKIQWKYAFLTPSQDSVPGKSNNQFEVVDMNSFLAKVAGDKAQDINEYWERVRRDHVEIEPLDVQDAHSVARGLFTEATKDQSAGEENAETDGSGH